MSPARVIVCTLLLCLGCDPAGDAVRQPGSDGVAAPVVPEGDALYALSEAERAALFDSLQAAVQRELGNRAAAARALELARLATAMVRLGGSASYVERAREPLRAVVDAGGEGACDVGLALARLQVAAARDMAGGYGTAIALARRFADEPGATGCVREARRMVALLEPELDDDARADAERERVPARASGRGEHGVVGDDAVSHWAAGEEQGRGQRSRLEDVVVYGADPEGERPLSEREVRVVLRFEGVAIYRRGVLPAKGGLPRRVFLDLDGVVVADAVDRALEVRGGGLDRIRIFELDEHTTRVSFDVGDSTGYRLFFLSDPYRIVLDFRDQGRAVAGLGKPGLTVVLDPGHGGEQPGATGPHGLKESHVALSLARRVRARLRRERPELRVLLTRDEDRFLTLEERTAIANGVDADLFLSIHLNASHSADDKGGVSTFVLDTTNDAAALRLAARENGTDEAGVTKLQFILASLYRADQVERSLALANEVQRSTLGAGRRILPGLYDRGVKRALFYVLVGARMPAALVEASFMTRPEEAAALHSDEYKDALAEGIASGVVRYLERAKKASK